MKRVITTMFALVLLTLGNVAMAQKGTYTLEEYKKETMPKYVVLVAEKGGLIFGSGVQVEKRRSKSKESLKWLQGHIRENKASRNLTDLLNTMDDLSFEFIDFVESSSDGIGAGDEITGSTSKNRILFVFKKKED